MITAAKLQEARDRINERGENAEEAGASYFEVAVFSNSGLDLDPEGLTDFVSEAVEGEAEKLGPEAATMFGAWLATGISIGVQAARLDDE